MNSKNLGKSLALGLPQDRGFRLGLAVSALQALSAVALLGVSAWLISRAAEQPPVLYLQIAVVLVRGFALGRATFRYLERVLLHNSAFKMLGAIRPRIFGSLIPLAPAGLSSLNRGVTVSKLVSDVDELQNLPLRVLSPLIQSIVVSIFSVAFFAWLSPGAAWTLAMCLAGAFFIAIPVSTGLAAAANGTANSYRRQLAGNTLDLLENLEVLEAYGWADSIRSRVTRSETALLRIASRNSLSTGIGQGLITLFTALATFGSAWFGAKAVSAGQIPGVMLASLALLPMAVFEVVTTAQPVLLTWQRYQESAQNLLALLDNEPDESISPAQGTRTLDHVKSLELKNLTASYPRALEPAIDGFNLKLRAGESVLLRGPSGVGKSTIALVLMRFLAPSSGEYQINEVSADQYDSDSIRARIGYIEQSPAIFMGTLRANLLIGKPNASDQELWQVLDRVDLAETFRQRDGLDTQVGERGVAVSGGEAQRIALARALLADFDVIVFDEPTSNVDTVTGQKLVRDLLSLAKQKSSRAVVLISHDPEHQGLVDQVIRLEK
ncbi:MAG: thiol reductant ABC exporter subunit CydC [Micrococcales bacterium]